MATESKSTIRSSGGDYTSLSGWISGEQTTGTDLTSRNVYILAECYDDWGSGLSDSFSISGFTTSSTVTPSVDNTTNQDVRITVASGHRHDGTPLSGFYITSTSNPVISVTNDCYIEWVDVLHATSATYRTTVSIASSAGHSRFEKLIVRGSTASDSSARGLATSSTDDTKTRDIINCLFYDSGVGINGSANACVFNVLNCTIADTGVYGIYVTNVGGGGRVVKNTVVYNSGNDCYEPDNKFDGTNCTNNASSDSTEPGNNPITTDIVSGDFNDAASNDWSVASTSSTLYDAGADLSSDFDDDIIGTSRSTWDVGAFEYFSTSTTLTVSAIASAEAFGSATLAPGAVSVQPSAISSAEAHGSATLAPGAVSVQPSAISSAEAHGDATLSSITALVISAIDSLEAFGTATLVPGAVSILPSGLASAEAFGAAIVQFPAGSGIGPIITQGFGSWGSIENIVLDGFSTTTELTLLPSAIDSLEAFGSHSLIAGSVNVLPVGITSSEAHGTATIAAVTAILVSAIDSLEAFGTAALVPGAVSLLPDGVTSGESFGTAYFNTGATLIAPSGILSAETIGDATLTTGAVSILPSGLASLEAFGTAVLSTGAIIVAPTGIATGEISGSPEILPGAVSIAPSSIESIEASGTPVVVAGSVIIEPSAITSAESFGTAGIQTQGVIATSSIASAEVFGILSIAGGAVSVLPSAIDSAEAFGALTVSPGSVVLLPSGIASIEQVGDAVVVTGAATISPSGIVSGELVGSSEVLRLLSILEPDGIASAEAFGQVVIIGGVEILGRLSASLRITPALTGSADILAALSKTHLEIN